jgi:hypothetical protein
LPRLAISSRALPLPGPVCRAGHAAKSTMVDGTDISCNQTRSIWVGNGV